MAQYTKSLSTSSLMGDNVRNAEGEDLGTLKDIMVDVDSGQIAYGVLSSGGVLGVGGKLFAIPWQAFRVDTENEELVLNVDKERLENAEGFDDDNWPDTANPEWVQQTYSQYGLEPRR